MELPRPTLKQIVSVLVILGIGALLMFLYLNKQKPGSFTIPFDRSLTPDAAAHFRSAYDIETLEKSIAVAKSADEEAQFKRGLAIEYLQLRNFKKMNEILREVAADTRYSSFERALAVQTMSDLFFERSDNAPQPAEENIFVGEPYNSMLDTSISDQSARVSHAFKKLSEYALSIEKTPISEFRIARWYIANSDLNAAKAHIESGAGLLPSYLEKLPDDIRTSRAKAHWLKGLALGEYGIIAKDDAAIAEARSSFDEALSLLRPDNVGGVTNPARSTEFVWANFHYTTLLARINDPQDTDRIAGMLQEIVTNSRIGASFAWHIVRIHDDAQIVEPHVSSDILRDLMRREPLFNSYVNRLIVK